MNKNLDWSMQNNEEKHEHEPDETRHDDKRRPDRGLNSTLRVSTRGDTADTNLFRVVRLGAHPACHSVLHDTIKSSKLFILFLAQLLSI